MMGPELFEMPSEPPSAVPKPEKPPVGVPRLLHPDRYQMRLLPTNLDSLLDEDHVARYVWDYVEHLDLSALEQEIKARGETPGRPAIDPRILITLWLYATEDGVGSARELQRLCEAHAAYQWICGGVWVNYHTLSDFRVGHEKFLDELMAEGLAVLSYHGLVELHRTSQDGMKVRASAGAASFRREKTLQGCLEEARQQVEELKQELHQGEKVTAREFSARKRAARERQERVQKALDELPKIREAKTTQEEKDEARASTTDPEARVMKMGDGGFRPAYNIQLSTDTESRVIVAAQVSTSGGDMGQMAPMLEEIQKSHGRLPQDHLVDGGFPKKEAIVQAAAMNVTVYAPVQKSKKPGQDPYQPRPSDPPAVAQWRQRMATPEAHEIYKLRAATSETINADLRWHRTLNELPVRTVPKVRCIVLWNVITYNLRRLIQAIRAMKN
jgi:transposase